MASHGEDNMRRKIGWFVLCSLWCLPISIGSSETFYRFHLGNHTVEETTVLFEFPDESVTALYAFNFSAYPALCEKRNQARIRIYDRNKHLLAEGKSICVKGGPNAKFGSIVFSAISRANVDQSAFFTLDVIPCQDGKNRLSIKKDPRLRALSAAVTTIAQILFPCMQTGDSKMDCICINRGTLKNPIGQAVSFLQNHPELREKELILYESTTSTHGGYESLTLSISLEEVYGFKDALDRCD